MADLSILAQTIIEDVKDSKITVEEIQEGLQNGDLGIVGLEAEAKEALTILQQ